MYFYFYCIHVLNYTYIHIDINNILKWIIMISKTNLFLGVYFPSETLFYLILSARSQPHIKVNLVNSPSQSEGRFSEITLYIDIRLLEKVILQNVKIFVNFHKIRHAWIFHTHDTNRNMTQAKNYFPPINDNLCKIHLCQRYKSPRITQRIFRNLQGWNSSRSVVCNTLTTWISVVGLLDVQTTYDFVFVMCYAHLVHMCYALGVWITWVHVNTDITPYLFSPITRLFYLFSWVFLM